VPGPDNTGTPRQNIRNASSQMVCGSGNGQPIGMTVTKSQLPTTKRDTGNLQLAADVQIEQPDR
jgi:hypothetical protein